MLNYFEINFPGDIELSVEATPVALSYISLLRGAKFIKYKRIDLFIKDQTEQILELEWIDSNHLFINMNYDVDSYKGKDPVAKRKMLYEILFYCMDFLATQKGWDLNFLNEVKSTVITHDYIVFSPYLKAIKNKPRKIIAQLMVCLDIGVGYFNLNIFDYKMQLIKTIEFYKVHPSPFIYSWYFTKIAWVEEHICRVEEYNGEILFDINIDDETVSTHFVPKTRSLKVLQNGILGLKYDTPWADRQHYLLQMMKG